MENCTFDEESSHACLLGDEEIWAEGRWRAMTERPSSLDAAFDYDAEQMERLMRYRHMGARDGRYYGYVWV